MKPTSSGRRVRASATTRAITRLTLAEFLPYRLNVLSSVVSEGLAETYRERFGIGVPEWRVIATLGEFGSVTAKTIGLHARMTKVKVSRAVSSLEARRMIRRSPNEDDRREAFLILSPEGRAVYDEIIPLALAYVQRLTEDFSTQELDELVSLMEKLRSRAESLRP